MNSPVPVQVTGLAEARSLLTQPYASEDIGLATCPAIFVELTKVDLATDPPSELPNIISSTPGVIIGLLPEELADHIKLTSYTTAHVCCEQFDIVLAPPQAELPATIPLDQATIISSAIAASPLAAVTLVQLLRLNETRSTVNGLVAESLAYSTLQTSRHYKKWLTTQPANVIPDNPETPVKPETPVVAERTASTLRITLNRPERHNAYNAQIRDLLVELLRAAWSDPSLDGIVINGTGPTFCSGGDLGEFGTTPNSATAHQIRSVRSAAFWIDKLAHKTRFEVHGTCVGAGVELPAYAHNVTAHPDTTFRLPEVSMGLVPGAGGTISIARRIGRQRLCYFALCDTEIDAETALSWGLIDRIQV